MSREGSPIRASGRTALMGYYASEEHRATELEILPLLDVLDWSSYPAPSSLTQGTVDRVNTQIEKIIFARTEEAICVPAVIILNLISLHHAGSEDRVQLFLSNPNQSLLGDPFDKRLKPDVVSYVSTSAQVWRYVNKLCTPGSLEPLGNLRPFWGELTSVGELKRRAVGQPQLLNYCDTLLQYRPDLARGVGIHIRSKGFQIYELTATGCSRSQEYPWRSLTELQRFVVGVYRATDERYSHISFIPNSIQLWNLKHDGLQYDMFPFRPAGHYPGRGTWLATGFELTQNQHHARPQLVFKFYWRDCAMDSTEGELYDVAHKGPVTISGLAKPLLFCRTGITVSTRRQGSDHTRELVFIILDVVCTPLSSCKSVSQIFHKVFDALETHQGMCEKGVIHRDMSFGNVGSPTDGTMTIRHPTIQYLSPDNLPRSVLMDLDLSSKWHEQKIHHAERTGTPMFIARDLSRGNEPLVFNSISVELHEFIKNHVSAIQLDDAFFESLPEGSQSLGRRLKVLKEEVLDMLSKMSYDPSANKIFWKHISRQLPAVLRGKQPQSTTTVQSEPPLGHRPRPRHEPQHDVESLFWLLWFLLARANPTGSTAPDANLEEYNIFCLAMFSHRVGHGEPRDALFAQEAPFTLHATLSNFAFTLSSMQTVLRNSPREWFRAFGATLPWNFHHKFMQFCILVDMCHIALSADVNLDTKKPRPAYIDVPVVKRSSSLHVRTLYSAPSLDDIPPSPSEHVDPGLDQIMDAVPEGRVYDPGVDQDMDTSVETEIRVYNKVEEPDGVVVLEQLQRLSSLEPDLLARYTSSFNAASLVQSEMLNSEKWFMVIRTGG